MTTDDDRPADLAREVQPCGTPTEDLLDWASGGPADAALQEHAAGCVHCRAVLARAEELWAPVRALAGRQEEPPADLLAAVMAAVRRLGRRPLHLVLPGDRGATLVRAAVLARLSEEAARRVPGVSVVLARDTTTALGGGDGEGARGGDAPGSAPAGRAAVGVADQQVVIALAVVADLVRPLPETAERVRRAVAAELAPVTGGGVVQVDIYVHDVVPGADG